MRDIGGRAAHVEADDALEAGRGGGARHRHDAARGAGQDRVLAGEQLRRREAARRHHEHQPRAAARHIELFGDQRHIAREDRREIGVDDGGVAAADELDQRRALVADGDLRKANVPRDFRHELFMRGMTVGVHEDNGGRVEAGGPRRFELRADSRGIRRALDKSIGVDAFVDFDDAGIKLFRLDDLLGEDFRARLIADFKRVAEAARRDQRGFLALAFEQRVGGDGRSHLHRGDRARRNGFARREAEQVADALHRGVAIGGGVFRQQLARAQAPARIAPHDVGERAAAVDPEVPAFVALARHVGPHSSRGRPMRQTPRKSSGSAGLPLR